MRGRYVAHLPGIGMGEFGYLVWMDGTFRILNITTW